MRNSFFLNYREKNIHEFLNIDYKRVITCLTLATTILVTPVYGQQIILDGNTNTTLNINNNLTEITTTTIKGANAFNSFIKFNVNTGNTVNLRVPSAASNLVNLVYDEQSNINGVLNSIKNGHIGGNIFLINPHGVVVGNTGVINVGSLTAVTPTVDYMNQFFDGTGNINNESVQSLLNGTLPINSDAVINIEGKINAINNVKLDTGSVFNRGEIYTNAVFKENNIIIGDVVNLNTLENGSEIVVNDNEIVIKAVNNIALDNSSIIHSQSGTINLEAGLVATGGTTDTSGQTGGIININAGTLSLAGNLFAKGEIGAGGNVNLNVTGKTWETTSSIIDVSGEKGGTINHIADQQITTSGVYNAIGNNGNGGNINITANTVKFLSTKIDASGKTGGGYIQLGGEYQGGKDLEEDIIPNTQTLIMLSGTEVKADTTGDNGDGGTIITWADQEAIVLGDYSAKPGLINGEGGFVEVSSGDNLTFDGNVQTGIDNRKGQLLLDPKNIIITNKENPFFDPYPFIIGYNYQPPNGYNQSLDVNDFFGEAVSLDGNCLAIGYPENNGGIDLGDDHTRDRSGAVYLYSFEDSNFNGTKLEAIIGYGFSGGKNISMDQLTKNNVFGSSVSLDGNRLAVGAPGYDTVITNDLAYGGVFLFSFTDSTFSGGQYEAFIGDASASGKSIYQDLSYQEWFGSSISLDGTQLAIGASGLDDGFSNHYGAVFLYSFSDLAFNNGNLEAAIGYGFTGDKNINRPQRNMELFGKSLSLNDNRLAVGYNGDLSGAVDLFTFSDSLFSNGVLEATIGTGYTGGKNIDQPLSDIEGFGSGVSLDDNVLAVGSDNNDGYNNSSPGSGAVYLYSFQDSEFTGGQLNSIIGNGYAEGNNYNLSLDSGDGFGSSVSLDGNRLAVGAPADDGNNNSSQNTGAVYLFRPAVDDLSNYSQYSDSYDQTVTINNETLTNLLSTPQDVTLKANNNILVNGEILVNNSSGNGGVLSLFAGKSIFINENITTDNANLFLIANDLLANGVIDSQREAGDAVIEMSSGAIINAGTGNVLIDLRSGYGKTYYAGGDISINKIYANDISINNSTDSIIDVHGDETPNLYGRNISLTSQSGTIGTLANNLNLYLNYGTNGGKLSAVAYNGEINVDQYMGNLDINYVSSYKDVKVTSDGSILDARDIEYPNVYGHNIYLWSRNGSIGTANEDLGTFLNFTTTGGKLTAIAYNGEINIDQYDSNLNIDYVTSYHDVKLYSVGSIIDLRDNEYPNVYGKNVSLTSRDGTIGTIGDDLDIYVNFNSSGGKLSAVAYNGEINLDQYEGNLQVNYVSSYKDVKINSVGSILDARDIEYPNVYGHNIDLISRKGSIGTSDEDFGTFLNFTTTGGKLSAVAYNGEINLDQYEGDLYVNYVSSYKDVKITSTGSILDARDIEYPNVYGHSIDLISRNGSIGTSSEDLGTFLNFTTTGGKLSAIAYNGEINLDQYEGDLYINYISSYKDVTVSSVGDIIDARENGYPNIYGNSIKLTSTNGNVGSAEDNLNIALNFNSTGGNLWVTAKNGLVNIREYYAKEFNLFTIYAGDKVTLIAPGPIITYTNYPMMNIIGTELNITSNVSIGTDNKPIQVYSSTGTVNADSPDTHVNTN